MSCHYKLSPTRTASVPHNLNFLGIYLLKDTPLAHLMNVFKQFNKVRFVYMVIDRYILYVIWNALISFYNDYFVFSRT